MGQLLFKLDKDSKIILHPEVLQLCSELSVLSQQEMLYVILRTDYCSIFAQFTEDDRARRACYHSFGDYIPDIDKRPKIKAAIAAYNSLQYSPKQEQVRVYEKKIALLLEELEDLSDSKKINDNMLATSRLRAGINELEHEIIAKYQEEEGDIVGGGERTFLEKIMKNKAYYESITKKK